MNVLAEIMSFYDSISLQDIGRVKLMNRVDTKFLLPPQTLVSCLSSHIEDYEVVEVNGKRILSYETIYFDTDGLSMYHEHHNGKKRRCKIRYREYYETGDKFLEIKLKEKNRTSKKRIRVDAFNSELTGEQRQFVQQNTAYYAEDLEPMLTTSFQRITLVNKHACERITIDLNIGFSDGLSKKDIANCVIVEIKRNKEDVYSSFARTIKEHGFLPLSISKYCLGTVALNNHVKYNRFKPRLRKVNNLMAQVDEHLALVV